LIKSGWKEKGEKKKIVIERKENEWKKSRRPKLEKWKYRGKKRKGTDRQLKMWKDISSSQLNFTKSFLHPKLNFSLARSLVVLQETGQIFLAV